MSPVGAAWRFADLSIPVVARQADSCSHQGVAGDNQEMRRVHVVDIDICGGRSDLTIVPCSGKMKKVEKPRNQARIDKYGLPTPQDLQDKFSFGKVSPIFSPTKNRGQIKYFAFAASVLNESDVSTIESIGQQIGSITRANPEIKLVEAPFLGCGDGALFPDVAMKALAKGFLSTSHSEAILQLCSDSASSVTIARRAIDELLDELDAATMPGKRSGDTVTKIRPRMFIGSSSEGLRVARAIAQQLQDQLEVTNWYSGLFGLGGGTLEALLETAPTFDFATLVLTPDDMTTSRETASGSPRDNVVFEAGMFMGILGRKRTFLTYDADQTIKIPSDLAGITIARYRGNRSDGNLVAAVDEACHQMRTSVEKLGPVSRGLLARAVTGTFALADPARIRKTIWFLGSDTELDESAKAFLSKFIPELCSRLVGLRCRMVVGDSALLREVAVAFRAAMGATEEFIPNPVVIEGNLRRVPADKLFLETVGQIPNIAIVIGGSKSRGRVQDEYENAMRANIPVLALQCIGGAAAEMKSTVEGAEELDSLAGKELRFVDSGELSRKVSVIVSKLG